MVLRKSLVFEKILTLIAAAVLIFVIGFIFYSEATATQVILNVKLRENEDPFVVMKSLMPSNAVLQDVRQLNRSVNEYQIKVCTNNKKALLEFIRNNKKVEAVRPNSP